MSGKVTANWINLIGKHASNKVFLYHIGCTEGIFLNWHRCTSYIDLFFRFCFATSYITGIEIWTRIPTSLILRSYDAFPIAIYFVLFSNSRSPYLTALLFDVSITQSVKIYTHTVIYIMVKVKISFSYMLSDSEFHSFTELRESIFLIIN